MSEGTRSDNAELRSRTSDGKLISTRNLSEESDCHVDSNETGDDMDCDIVEVEDGEIAEITEKSKQVCAFLQEEIDELISKAPSKEEDTKAILKRHRQRQISEAWTNGTVFPLTQYFEKTIEGKFTTMYFIPSLDRTSLNYIKYIYPGFIFNKEKKIDEWNFKYYLEYQESFINWRRFNLSREPLIDIDTSNNKEAAYLSALIHLHSFNDCYVKQHVCPCFFWTKQWKESFCFFEDDLPECKDGVFDSSLKLFKHCQDKGKNCRWHYLSFKFMKKVFFKKYDLSKPIDCIHKK